MSEDLVKFSLPAEFILSRVVPTPDEMVYGYRHGWIDDEGAVRVAEAELLAGMAIPAAIEELALLLRDHRFRVADLMRAAADELSADEGLSRCEAPERVWLYLALDWLYEHRGDFVEPLGVIEMIYADFDYPEEIEGLIRFMPARQPGAVVGRDGIVQRWRDYLARRAGEYSVRRSSK